MTNGSYDEGEPVSVLKRDVLGRVKTTAQQREALLDEFERSGLSGAQFAQVAGVNYQTFASWVQRRRRATGGYEGKAMKEAHRKMVKSGTSTPVVPALGWVEAVVDPSAGSSAKALPLMLELPGGVRLQVSDLGHATLAAQLIKALQAPC